MYKIVYRQDARSDTFFFFFSESLSTKSSISILLFSWYVNYFKSILAACTPVVDVLKAMERIDLVL